ncbi:competence protein ComGB [Halobacillus dabanensis]|uniref:Competence protein ComGB n=2 Tax=Halobacillus dabanensis TaxID=240302 RepID=A0A1I3PIS4_HALDA|nr:competence protein ComGB [Halobacillus dabanensis]
MLSASFLKMKWNQKNNPRLSIQHQINFFKRLSHILEKGYPLLDALKMTGWDIKLKPTSAIIEAHLRAGAPFHIACEKAHLSQTVTNFLYFSHTHYDLPKCFIQCKDLLEMKQKYKQKLLRVIRYPIFLFIFLVIAFTVMQKTVMPNFITLFEGQNNQNLTLMNAMIFVLNTLGGIAVFIILLLLAFVFILPRLDLSKKISLYENIPPLKIYQSFLLSLLFTTHLYSLLQAGLTLKEAIELMEQHKKYDILSHYSNIILAELSQGKSFAQAIYQCSLFRKELTNIFHHTNDIQALKDELEMLSDFFMEYIEQKINSWLHLIQPIFFIIIAIVIISIYASIMLPLYQWMNQI